jgi:Spy/CpxP family protein refolding chaperone
MRTETALRCLLGAAAFLMVLALAAASAEEEKCLRPEIQQLVQSVGEKLQAAADKFGLNAEQQAKIREIDAGQAEQRMALRTQRRNLLQEEMKSLASILTPEQREKIKEFAEDKAEQVRETPKGLPKFSAACDTLAERAHCAAERLGLTSEQRTQIIQTLSKHSEQHAALRAKCKEWAENEFKAVAAVLTPDQKMKARRDLLEDRVVIAAAARSVADRLNAAAEKISLSDEQKQKILKTHSEFDDKYCALRAERRELMQQELKAIAAILTPEQREKVGDFCEDRVVVVEATATASSADEAIKALRESIAERMEAVADKLELTAAQRDEIRGAQANFADKFKAQREQRTALRREELKALGVHLTPEQREKAKDLAEDYVMAP